ncbi:MAG: FUSC family protein, partial [Actinocrinis sp.]
GMGVVGFFVLFSGVVSSVLAGATTSLLLAFILPVSLSAPAATIPHRLAGWALATAMSMVAISLMWPAPANDPLRGRAAAACRALAARLRSELAHLMAGQDCKKSPQHTKTVADSDAAVAELQRMFLATPYRPTGLSTSARAVVRLVDELAWLNAIITQARPVKPHRPNRVAYAVKQACASVLDDGAALLVNTRGDIEPLRVALTELRSALTELELDATGQIDLPIAPAAAGAVMLEGTELAERTSVILDEHVGEVIDALDPSFRAQEMSFVVSMIGRNIEQAARADRRSWPERLLGRQPDGLPGTFTAARERAVAHLEPHSVWLRNSVRGAIGLGLAVLVANLTGVQHSFWVVLGTLSVLRSSALNTGQNVLRAVVGTSAGFLIGSLLLVPIGHDTNLLWFLLPPAILLAGIAPAAISFAAGQAGFTLVLVILFNIIQPTGWRVGLLRVEDIAIGCAVSLAVGVLFWPRGAAAALSKALAEAYTDSARYLAAAVEFGMDRCDACKPAGVAPTQEAVRSAAASRRMDDTFREYLAERGAKKAPLAEISRLVSGVTGLRLAADAVLDLWERNGDENSGDRDAARFELLRTVEQVREWYDDLADSLDGVHPIPALLDRDADADGRLVRAVQTDLRDEDGKATATAVRMIWTGDHLDAVRRLQPTLVQPALAARVTGLV